MSVTRWALLKHSYLYSTCSCMWVWRSWHSPICPCAAPLRPAPISQWYHKSEDKPQCLCYKLSLSGVLEIRVLMCASPSGFPEESAQSLCRWGRRNKGWNQTDQSSSRLCPGWVGSEIPPLLLKHQNRRPGTWRNTTVQQYQLNCTSHSRCCSLDTPTRTSKH